MEPTFLDRALSWIAPELAGRRLAARAAFGNLADTLRAYDAAKVGRRTDGWIATGGSANAEIGAAAARVRHRTRDLVRNNPYAAMAVRRVASAIVGAGIVPRLKSDDRAAKLAAAEDWEVFAENCDPEGLQDFYGLQALVVRTVWESGEALVRFLPRPSGWKLRVPLQLQVLEPDQLDATKNEALRDGGVIVQGVEYDRWGRRAAYWLFEEHPGDTVVSLRRSMTSVRVPAAEILHVFERHRPGQARGISAFAPVALKLRDLDDYDDAELVRKKIAACLVAFVRRPTASSKLLTGDAKGMVTDSKNKPIESMRPGMIAYTPTDQQVDFVSPTAADGFKEYFGVQLHAVAAGVGTTYEQLTGDLSDVNFTSIRAGAVMFNLLNDQWQWHMMVPQLCQPVWRRVDRVLVATGRRRDTGARAIWAPPAREYVNPQQDMQAQILAIRSGLKDLRQAIAERGEDPDEQLQQIADTLAQLDKYGIKLDSDGRRPANGNVAGAKDGGAAEAKAPATVKGADDGEG